MQDLYFFVLGLWPLISIETFQAVSGRKTDHLVTGSEADHWLVNTVGLLIAAIGIVLLAAGWRRHVAPEIVLLGVASALCLAAIDIICVARDVISPLYLADAVVELIFAAAWTFAQSLFAGEARGNSGIAIRPLSRSVAEWTIALLGPARRDS